MAQDSSANGSLATDVTYEDLIDLEYLFEDAELQVLKAQTTTLAPLYAKREAVISRIPNFWALVVEQAPMDLDQYIQPSDSEVFGECLQEIKIDRFDESSGESPRSFSLTMRFDKNKNKWFDDETLTKHFWMRRARDGWNGLVSEPVKISWKKGQDLTSGLTDAAVALWEARQAADTSSASPTTQAELPEHKAIVKKLESNDPSGNSFFTLFGYVSERRYVTAAESAEATKKIQGRHESGSGLKNIFDTDEETEQAEFERQEVEQEAEVYPNASDVANFIAEDLYPDAVKYFTSAQEQDDEELSEADFEDMDEDDSQDEEIDIRALVKGKSSKRSKNDSDVGSPHPPKSKKNKS